MDVKNAFGTILKKYRVNLKLSQERFALLCSLDRTYISLLERGQRCPSLSTILIIAKNLNVEPVSFFKEVLDLIDD